jgi:hypothetical protein
MGFTDARMLPSELWQTAFQYYKEVPVGLITTTELDMIKVELLDFVSWAIRIEEVYEADVVEPTEPLGVVR